MKLERINYGSAVFFGVSVLVLQLVVGLVQFLARDALILQGYQVVPFQVLVAAPLIGGVVGYLVFLVMIVIYNAIAMKYPISWEVKK